MESSCRIVRSFAALAMMLWVATAAIGAETPQADLYVAPTGNDAWSGTLAQANGTGDGPFASIGRAQQALRAFKRREPDRQRPFVIMLRGGHYELAEPLVLGPEDSGTEAAPVIYAAYPGERPVLSGGRRLNGWRVQDGRWELALPEVAQGAWRFSQLFVEGQRRYRPRAAGGKYLYIRAAGAADEPAAGRPRGRFGFYGQDLRANWRNLHDVEVLVFHYWSMSRLPVESIDPASRTLTMRGRNWSDEWAPLGPGERYLVENVAEELKETGQWYLDRPSGTLRYLPPPGEDPATTEVIAPRLQRLVEFAGDEAGTRPVQHIILRGLALEHTNWNVPETGYSVPQAESPLGAAVTARFAQHCALEQCTIAHTGAYAVEWGQRCTDDRVEDCELLDLGAGGVKIGTMETGEAIQASRISIRDCLIAHGGRMHPAGVGVWIGHSPHNVVEHNEIVDLYYSGISAGWKWGPGFSQAHHNTLAYNHIHQIGQGRLSDMGGIYTLGESPGTVERLNHIHDVNRVKYGGWGIYLDEGSSDILVENNLVHDTQDAGFNLHYGARSTIRNNIFAFGQTAEIGLGKPERSGTLSFEHNIIYTDQPKMTDTQPADGEYHFDRNIYWSTSGQPLWFTGDRSLAQWQALGQDADSLVADPGFVDAAQRDFRLKGESRAIQSGFVSFDISGAGRRTPNRQDAQRPVPHAYPAAPPAPALGVEEDWELTPVGRRPASARMMQNNPQETVQVTDETAAAGKHSLKVIDGPSEPFFNPHFYYEPHFKSGRIQGRFAIRLEPGAQVLYEWRDWPSMAQPYHPGPSLAFAADGTLRTNGRVLLKLPHGQWVRITVVCGTGPQANGRYTLTVQLPEPAKPQSFADLACDAQFKTLDWVGWTAVGTQPAVFYVDEIQLQPG